MLPILEFHIYMDIRSGVRGALISAYIFVHKMLSAYYVCCIFFKMHFRLILLWKQTLGTQIRLLLE